MPKCDCCRKIFKKLEDWGIVKLCPECVQLYKDGLPEKTKEKHMNIKIDEPRLSGGASYDPWTEELKFRQREFSLSKTWEEIINHEFMHFLLHRMIGIRCCYQYDGIYHYIDSYHSSI